MTEKTYWESFKAESEQIVDKIRQLIHAGNVRRVVVKQQGRTIAEFPLRGRGGSRARAGRRRDRGDRRAGKGLHD